MWHTKSNLLKKIAANGINTKTESEKRFKSLFVSKGYLAKSQEATIGNDELIIYKIWKASS